MPSGVRGVGESFPYSIALGMRELYRVEVPKCRRWRQAHSQRQDLNREVPTEGSPRQTIDLANRNGFRQLSSGKTAKQVEALTTDFLKGRGWSWLGCFRG